MANDPFKYFRVEAHELVDQLGKGVLELERGEASVVPKLLRLAHTLKGAARVVRRPDVAENAHAIEDTLAPYRDGGQIPRKEIDTALGLLDRIAVSVASLSAPPDEAAGLQNQTPAGEPAATPSIEGKRPAGDPYRAVWAEIGELDALLEGVAETHSQVAMLASIAADLGRARVLSDQLAQQIASRREMPGSARADRWAATADELRGLVAGLARGVATTRERIERELHQVHDTAEQLRLVPAGTLFSFLERATRDAARALGKNVHFEARGGEIRLDSQVLRTMHEALLQVVRNAVAHGIEDEADRIAAGKPAFGAVTVAIARRGKMVVFRCQDDGGGIDVAALKRAAGGRGVSIDDRRPLSGADILGLLGKGLSTSRELTEVSGRGVGIEVVRDAIARLGGTVSVDTAVGRGTTFEFVVPLTLASTEALLVECNGMSVGIPFEAVRQVIRVTPEQSYRTASGNELIHDDQAMPCAPLSRLLGERGGTSPSTVAVVVEEAGGRRAAFSVDGVKGTANLVLRTLPQYAPAGPLVAGAALDAEGNPQIVLDPEMLVAGIESQVASPTEDIRKPAPILIVDDSVTTRMLEQSSLESAGYEVGLATSAEEALEMARLQPYSMFLVDVEMPGMNGFSFIERIRADSSLRETPAILVTSLDEPENRQRGVEVGADGYVVKSEFDQADLLRRIEELVG